MRKIRSLLRLPKAGRKLVRAVKATTYRGTAANAATAADIERCYQFFLGREPENAEVVASRVGMVLGHIAESFLGSSEFAMIYASMVLGGDLGRSTASGAIDLELARWAEALAEPSHDLSLLMEQRLPWIDHLARWMHVPGVRKNFPVIASVVDGAVVGHADEVNIWRVHGWAVDPRDPNRKITVKIFANGEPIGVARADIPRPDVGRARELVPRCGFSLSIRRDQLQPGKNYSIEIIDAASGQAIGAPRRIRATRRANDDLQRFYSQLDEAQHLLRELRARIPALERSTSYPLDAYSYHADLEEEERAGRTAWHYRRLPVHLPRICFVVATAKPGKALEATLWSVRRQLSDNWAVLLVDRSGDPALVADTIRRVFGPDERVKVVPAREDTLTGPIKALSADYLMPLAPGTRLSPDASYELGNRVRNSGAAAVYSDHDWLAETVGHLYENPALKPDFDYDLLLSTDYVGPAVMFAAGLVDDAPTAQLSDPGAGRDELLLHLAEAAGRKSIEHIPLSLVHLPADLEISSPGRVDTLNRHFARHALRARATPHEDALGASVRGAAHIRWALPEPRPSVAIIIPTRDGLDMLRDCIDSILAVRAAYPGEQEILIIDNGSEEPETLAYFDLLTGAGSARVVRYDIPFNWSAINNYAATLTTADVVVFLNNDTIVRTPDWLVELVSLAMRPDVGAVGARLLYQDGSVQHAGVVCSYPRGFIHDSIGEAEGLGGYGNRVKLTRETMAATGACLASRRRVFEEMGGFDDVKFKVAYNDMDYCLRLRRAGYRVVYSAFAVLYHLESKTRGQALFGEKLARDRLEASRLFQAWDEVLQHDPFYNVNFDRFSPPFDRLRPRYS